MVYEQEYQDGSETDEEYGNTRRPQNGPPNDYLSSPTDSNPRSAEQTPTTNTHPGTAHASPKDRISDWNSEQCADWIASLGSDFEKYADKLVDEEVNGEALVAIQHEELKEMGMQSLGHRLTVLKAIYDIKVKQNLPIEPDHYIPLSADANAPDAHATQHDIARIIHQIKLRDERVLSTQAELRTLKEDVNRIWEDTRRLREDMLPALRLAKDNKPLPVPDGLSESLPSPHGSVHPILGQALELPLNSAGALKMSDGLSRVTSLSRKKTLRPGGGSKLPSPTIRESMDPLGPSISHGSQQAYAAHIASSQPSPTSPPYTTTTHPASRGYPQGPLSAGRTDQDTTFNNRPYSLYSTSNTQTSTDNHSQRTIRRPVPGSSAAASQHTLNSVTSFPLLTSPNVNANMANPLDIASASAIAGEYPTSMYSSNPTSGYNTNATNSTYIANNTPISTAATTPFTSGIGLPLSQTSTTHSLSSQPSRTHLSSHSSTTSTPTLTSASDFMKSFRVNMDEPCHKVLPVALRKYHINDDWRQYSLYIVHGDQERCLGLEEKPLILFKQLAGEGKKPMFMLRRREAPVEGFVQTAVRREDGGGEKRLAGGLV